MKFDIKQQKINIAKETLEILEKGKYEYRRIVVDFKNDLDSSIKNTKLYKPDNKFELEEKELSNTIFEVTNESTFAASKRLLDEEYENVCCLNFASARRPGGGFLTGSLAQEESLARASGLYATIEPQKEMYDYNNKNKSSLYSDYMIYSPNVPVFRDDNDNLLNDYYNVSIITSPAVNVSAIKSDEKNKIESTMIQRIDKILTLADKYNNDAIVLGAFGCGVFRNNPNDVARYFDDLLKNKFKGRFKRVVFAIKTSDQKLIDIFNKTIL